MYVHLWNTANPWSLYTTGNINKVEAVQRRFTKSINGLSSLSYISRLNELSLETIELRRLKQDLVMCFKIVNGDVDIEPNSIFTFSINGMHDQMSQVQVTRRVCARRCLQM